MLNDAIVVDGVAHAYAFDEANRAEECPPFVYERVNNFLWELFHRPLESLGGDYQLERDEFLTDWRADELASIFFEESDVDVICRPVFATATATRS